MPTEEIKIRAVCIVQLREMVLEPLSIAFT